MKTINLKSVIIDEIIHRPQDKLPVVAIYRVFDDAGVFVKAGSLQIADLPAAGQDALKKLLNKIQPLVEAKELGTP